MAINISEQFIVNVSLPVDSRIVASNSTDREAISFKYDGLKVFQQDDRSTYVWNEVGSTWSFDGISGAGDTDSVAKWSSSNGLTSSSLYENSGKVGINTSSPQAELQINNGVSQPFVIHKDNGTIIAHNWYNNGSDQFFNNTDGSGAIKFRNNGEIWILTRGGGTSAINSTDGNFTNAAAVFYSNNISLTKDTTFNTGSSPFSSARIRATNSFSNATTPDYTWAGDDQTGFYHPAINFMGITVGGTRRAIINATGFLLSQNTSISGPAARLHIDNGNAAASFLKFTAGTTTGAGTGDGFDIGINTSGNPIIRNNEESNLLFSFRSNSNISHFLNSRQFVMFPETNGVQLNQINIVDRVITGTGRVDTTIDGSVLDVATFSVPNFSYFNIEATFIITLTVSGTTHFRTHKVIRSYSVNNSGVITEQNIGTTPNVIFDRYSTSGGGIFIPLINISTNGLVRLSQPFSNLIPGTFELGTCVVSYKVIINPYSFYS
jgi:hypothetical protein